MEEQNYDTIAAFEKKNWWYRAKRDLFSQILKRLNRTFDSALDLGCGVGSNYEVLSPFAKNVTGIDYSATAISYARKKKYTHLAKMDATRLTFKANSFDLIICSDVLEHIDDKKAIKEIARVLRPGGVFLCSVPAHRYLWGPTDVISQHMRRYEKHELQSLLKKDFSLKKLSFWNVSMFLPDVVFIRLLRLIGKSHQKKNALSFIPAFLNTLIYTVVRIENQWFIRFNNVEGVSLVGIAYKHDTKLARSSSSI